MIYRRHTLGYLDCQRVSFFGSPIKWVEFSASLTSKTSGIAGNIGFVMFTCIGADPRDFILEACTFMKQKDPKLETGLEISSCATWVDGGDMARLSDGSIRNQKRLWKNIEAAPSSLAVTHCQPLLIEIHFKSHEVLFLGHWNMAGSGCPAGGRNP